MTTTEKPPRVYLFNWREITTVLGIENSPANRRRVRRLVARHAGPIYWPSGQGGQPHTGKAEVLAWWQRVKEEP